MVEAPALPVGDGATKLVTTEPEVPPGVVVRKVVACTVEAPVAVVGVELLIDDFEIVEVEVVL